MITDDQRSEFDERGYLIVRGLLDVTSDIDPCREAYIGYLDTLAEIFLTETKADLRANLRARPFPERFAMLLGCSGGSVLQHLDPTLSMFLPRHRWRADLPSAQRPELFRLIHSERLLNAVEMLIGPEITASPVYHLNLKLAQSQLQVAATIAAATGQDAPGGNPLWKFHVGGQASWHTDAAYGLPDSFNTRIVNAWIPLTPATTENGCLLVSPGSHHLKPELVVTSENVTRNALPLPVSPGDVIFLDNNIAHTAVENSAKEEIRWAFNFRYLPTGQPTGRPFLPAFVARSRAAPERELHDPELWSQMWRAALEFLSRNPLPPDFGRAPGEAEAITARWQTATHDYTDWLDIGARIKQLI